MFQKCVVAAAVIDDGTGKLLIGRRREGKANGGHWEFPGGKVEDNETPRAAVRREISEELGVQIQVGDCLCRTLCETTDGTIELICFWAHLIEDPPLHSTDHDLLVWFRAAELPSEPWCQPDLEAVRLLKSGISYSPRNTLS